MKVVLPLLVFLIVACGNEEVSKAKSQSTNSLAQNSGILSIPHPNIVGGGAIIKFNNSDFYLGRMSEQSTQYYIALKNGNIFVPPIYRDQVETGYRIHFVGSPTKGPCPFNGLAECSVINVESMRAY